jgi:TolB-like protein/DNA-binding winged helix-turn-helix (wHTH) protein
LPLQHYRFADLTLDLGRRRLSRGDEQIQLPKLSFEFLRVLVEYSPNLVTHEELAAKVWGPRRTVTPENLTQRLLMLRHSLGDDALRPRYIESVRAQGCRLIPLVEVVPSGSVNHSRARGSGWIEGRRASPSVFGVGIVAVLLLTGVFSWKLRPVSSGRVIAAESATLPSAAFAKLPNSIAILPFENLNDEPEPLTNFAEAVHAELINELGKSIDLNVIARASVLHYRDSTVPIGTIAQELRVGTIVSGSIRYSNDRIQLIAELLDTDTGVRLWSKRYRAQQDDLFAVQRDITANIAATLAARFAPEDRARLERLPTTSAEAYAFYMRAMDIFNANTLGGRTTAQTYLDQAIALDEKFAHAYAGKALVHTYAIINAGDAFENASTGPAEHEKLVRDYAATALSLNPDTDLAYYALGMLDMFSWRWREARGELRRAVELTPQHPVFLSQLAWLEVCALEEGDGRRYADRAVALDPRNPYVYELFSNVLDCLGDAAAALAATEKALEIDATSFPNRMSRAFRIARAYGAERGLREIKNLEPLLTGQRVLSLPAVALAYRELGQPDDARRLFDQFSAFAAESRTGPANWYLAYLATDDYDSAYAALLRAAQRPGPGPGFYSLVSFVRNPGSRPPFDQPRFLELRDRLRSRR